MAIIHARVDEGLIHGQVATVWTNTVGATHIIVVNDKAAKDKMIIAGLRMARPAGVKLSVLPKKRAVEKFTEKTYEGGKVFLITENVGDMTELVKAGLLVPAVNAGNVAKREGPRPIKEPVDLTEQDITDIKGLIKSGIPVTAQMVPDEPDQTILNYL